MAVALDSSSLVTVYGGSGFVGRHVVQNLAKTGCRMRIAVRRPDLAGHLQPLGDVGQIHAVQANLRYPDSVRAAAEGADAVVNLVGILFEQGRQKSKTVHAEGADAVARAAREAGAKALVHLSSIGADPQSRAGYARTKAAGEQAVRDGFPEAVILRASVIFGPEDDFMNRFGAMARMLPALPLIGGGKTRFQPVFVCDVAEAVRASLDGRAKPGAIYELGGPEVASFRELMKKVLHHVDRRRPLISLPFWLAKLEAAFLQLLPKPILTVDQVRMLQSDNVVSDAAAAEGRTLAGLGIEPTPMDAVVPGYLERFRARGQFSAYRL